MTEPTKRRTPRPQWTGKKRTTMWMDRYVLERLDETAKATKRSRTSLLHDALKVWLRKNGPKPSVFD